MTYFGLVNTIDPLDQVVPPQGADKLQGPTHRHDAGLLQGQLRAIPVEIATSHLDAVLEPVLLDLEFRLLEHREGVIVSDQARRLLRSPGTG